MNEFVITRKDVHYPATEHEFVHWCDSDYVPESILYYESNCLANGVHPTGEGYESWLKGSTPNTINTEFVKRFDLKKCHPDYVLECERIGFEGRPHDYLAWCAHNSTNPTLDFGMNNIVKDFLSDPLKVQVGGDHYTNKAIQPIQYIQANNLSFEEGSIVKYITRWKEKGGIKDLEKIKHYVDLIIANPFNAINIKETKE